MSNETCVVSIADIYGDDWWQRNKAELEREWEWSFKLNDDHDSCLAVGWGGLKPFTAGMYEPHNQPRIILHRRKPKPPTLRDVYGVDEVTIPAGWEWTGEWRVPVVNDQYIAFGSLKAALCTDINDFPSSTNNRLILRERKPKVWFKAEEEARYAKKGDWFWSEEPSRWSLADKDFVLLEVLCATRHEEIDTTIQVVTQADVDKVVNHA